MRRVTFVETFATEAYGGATVAVVQGGDPGPRGQAIAAALGCAATAFVLPPRREDCEARVRVFTPRRELPLSVKAAIAVAEVLGASAEVAIEQGVIRTVARREGAARWSMALPRPVLGSIPIDNRALAASALGLAEDDLDAGLPIVSASCGVLMVVAALRSREAVARAAVQPALWQRLIEKAKPFGAVLVGPAAEGDVALRCLRAAEGDDVGTGVAGASTAVFLLRHGVRAAAARQVVRFEQRDGTRRAVVDVAVDGMGDRDDAVRVMGDVARVGQGEVEA